MLPVAQTIIVNKMKNIPQKYPGFTKFSKSPIKIIETPINPIINPAKIFLLNFGPLCKIDSIPTTQNGIVVINKLASPLGIHCSAITKNPFEKPISIIPISIKCFISLLGGNFILSKSKIKSKIGPAIIHLNPAKIIGGTDSIPILIAMYVVPQTIHIETQARYAFNSDLSNVKLLNLRTKYSEEIF